MNIKMLVDHLMLVRKTYGDRDVQIASVQKTDGKWMTKFESIRDIHVVPNDINEPFTIYAERTSFDKREEAIKLNWLGRKLKRFIIQL